MYSTVELNMHSIILELRKNLQKQADDNPMWAELIKESGLSNILVNILTDLKASHPDALNKAINIIKKEMEYGDAVLAIPTESFV